MKRIILLSILVISLTDLFAQQDPQYSQYMFNSLAINPAYAGSRDVLSMTALYRKQWVGLAGAPSTQTITADSPIMKDKVGIGGIIFNDKIGIQSNTGVSFCYSYRIRLSRGTLALGMSAGIAQYRADLTSVALSSVENNTVVDPAYQTNVNKILPNFGAGVYYSTDRFYIGASAPHLMNNSLAATQISSGMQYGKLSRHYFLMAGSVFTLSNSIKYKPSCLIKVVEGSPIQMDINSNVWFQDRIALGISYRTSDALVAMVEIQINNQLRFGYAYDHSLTKLSTYNTGSHEVMLRYEFGYGGKVIVSPRYF